jgi:hypothetical protein
MDAEGRATQEAKAEKITTVIGKILAQLQETDPQSVVSLLPEPRAPPDLWNWRRPSGNRDPGNQTRMLARESGGQRCLRFVGRKIAFEREKSPNLRNSKRT